MSEKIIEVSGLQKSYKGNHVLQDVSFTVDKGSIFSLLGSNGAGKNDSNQNSLHITEI